ncbi:MAG: hypothetical protein D4R90_01535 [Nitrosopumilales archaeon]|nr:MAG: hypothetical protein D4R90_01535 [Nitrosopumilales archaeon]
MCYIVTGIFTYYLLVGTGQKDLLPRKEYKTITVKSESFQKFIKAIKNAKKDDPSLDNSTFLNSLLSKYKKN